MKYSIFPICSSIDCPVYISKTNYCWRKELDLVCYFMNWPFRELMLCIHQVLHVFSKSLVASVINPESWALTRSILPWESPSSLLLSNSALVQGFVSPWGCPDAVTTGHVQVSSPLFWMDIVDRHDSLLFSLVSSPLWTLNPNVHPGMPGDINEPCTKTPFLSTRSPFCRTGWGHCLFLGSPLTSSSSSLFLAVPYIKSSNKLKIMRMLRLAITVFNSQQPLRPEKSKDKGNRSI